MTESGVHVERPHPARPSCSARPRRSPLVHTAASLSLSLARRIGWQAWIFILKQATQSYAFFLPSSSGLILLLAPLLLTAHIRPVTT